jgi:integrase
MIWVAASGWDTNDTCEAGTSTIVALARSAMNRCSEVHVARQPWRASTTVAGGKAFAHIRRKFADRPLVSIRKGDVQAFATGLDMRASTAALVLQHLNSLLEAAVEDSLITRNPARGVKLPAVPAGEFVPPTVEQVEALYEAAVPWFRPAVLLGAGLGWRQSEACGLTADRVLWLTTIFATRSRAC